MLFASVRERCGKACTQCAAALVLILSSAPLPTLASIGCDALKYGQESYAASMHELARESNLRDGYANRYHELLVAQLCSGDSRGAVSLVDEGFVRREEAERIAIALGLTIQFQRQSEAGSKYHYVREQLVSLGACSACADNIARYYLNQPKSQCALLAQRALQKDPASLNDLLEFPAYCHWKYLPAAH